MGIAYAASQLSTCPRASVGAVMVDDRDMICGVGYNGSPRGCVHCADVGCSADSGNRCKMSVHAELNALLNSTSRGKVLYSTHKPCLECVKAMINFGVTRVVYDVDYPDDKRDLFLGLQRNFGKDVIAIEEVVR